MIPDISMSAQIEILAAPARVREVFMDFARFNQWHQGWDITLADANKKPTELQPGDALKVNMHGMKMNPSVAENTPASFAWTASLVGLVGGTHYGCTTFIQYEDFHGALMFFFWPWRNKKFSSDNWDNFNEALKEEAEKRAL